MFFDHEISLFFKTRKTYKNQLFFNNFVFTKIHLENPYHFFAPRISVFDREPFFLSYVCNGVNICNFLHIFIKRCMKSRDLFLVFIKKTYYKTTLSLRILTKHEVRLRRYSFVVLCDTSAVALLEIHETSVKSS